MQFVEASYRLNKYREHHAKALAKLQEMQANGVDKLDIGYIMQKGCVTNWLIVIDKMEALVDEGIDEEEYEFV